MKGYGVNMGSGGPFTVSHTGRLYQGNQTISIVNSGDRFNYLSNPFTSYVDLKTTSSWKFGDIEPTVWQRTKSGSAYSWMTFNLSENVGTSGFENGLLAPMQGFWVRALTSMPSGGVFAVDETARKHSVGVQAL